MTYRFAQNVSENSTTAMTPSDDGTALALDAARSHRSVDLEAHIRPMVDRSAFFSMHGAELAQAALQDASGDCLAVLLKLGMYSNADLIQRITIDGNVHQQNILREYTDKSDMLKRWVRESGEFCQKFRYKIKSVF